MGRPEKPLDNCPPRKRALAMRLRDERIDAQLTYEQMASPRFSTGPTLSAATYKRAASGEIVPKWATVVEFVTICRASGRRPHPHRLLESPQTGLRGELRKMWVQARMEERGTLHVKRRHPQFINDAADFSMALVALYEHTGAPPLREFRLRAGRSWELPLATLARIINRQTLPADEVQLKAFLRACEVMGTSVENDRVWMAAWDRVYWRRQMDDQIAGPMAA